MSVTDCGLIIGRCRPDVRVDETQTVRVKHGRMLPYVHVQLCNDNINNNYYY